MGIARVRPVRAYEVRSRYPVREKDRHDETSTPSQRVSPLWRVGLVHPQGSVSMPVRLLAVFALRIEGTRR